MLLKVLLVDGLEVAWQALGLHRMCNWGTFLDSFRRVGINEAEVFERLRVGRRKFKVCRNVATQSKRKKHCKMKTNLESTYLRLLE